MNHVTDQHAEVIWTKDPEDVLRGLGHVGLSRTVGIRLRRVIQELPPAEQRVVAVLARVLWEDGV